MTGGKRQIISEHSIKTKSICQPRLVWQTSYTVNVIIFWQNKKQQQQNPWECRSQPKLKSKERGNFVPSLNPKQKFRRNQDLGPARNKNLTCTVNSLFVPHREKKISTFALIFFRPRPPLCPPLVLPGKEVPFTRRIYEVWCTKLDVEFYVMSRHSYTRKRKVGVENEKKLVS